jgi:hypothetical protein
MGQELTFLRGVPTAAGERIRDGALHALQRAGRVAKFNREHTRAPRWQPDSCPEVELADRRRTHGATQGVSDRLHLSRRPTTEEAERDVQGVPHHGAEL